VAFLVVSGILGVAIVAALVARSSEGAGPTPGGSASSTSASLRSAGRTDEVGDVSRCPWLESAMDDHRSPGALAALVLRRMTTGEKLAEMVLVSADGYENTDAGVARLCIPPLTLQDGPQGVAFGAVHVTQLPAPIGVAATFDPGIATAYGRVQGDEAADQGIDVVQGPDLNLDRVPESGRSYEDYSEDPLLTSVMGVADIGGIQSTGELAMAKHFAVYSQETDRGVLDDQVSERALEELYLPPFKAAVTEAHVSSVMCAYPQLNGTYQCQDPQLLSLLAGWGFTGIVRSDLGSVHDPAAAILAGTDLLKPSAVHSLAELVREHEVTLDSVDDAVDRLLTEMFAHGLIGQPTADGLGTDADSPADAQVALTTAERSAVLLKNAGGVLPLRSRPGRSVAVIGAAASTDPVTTGYGSSRVLAPFVSSPLAAIRNRAGPGTTVRYVDGGSTTGALAPIPAADLTPSSGGGHGLTLTLTQKDPDVGPSVIRVVAPTADIALSPNPATGRLLPDLATGVPVARSRPILDLGSRPLSLPSLTSPERTAITLPAGWSAVTAALTGTLTPPATGPYTLSLQGPGTERVTLDGHTVVADPLVHGLGRWSQTVQLLAGHRYRIRIDWSPVDRTTPTGESSVVRSSFSLGWQFDGAQIAAAVAAARASDTAVVFAGDYESESFDRPSLALPGDENDLIEAVAAANPHTVVVLDTGGPVLMPWLDKVAGVIEAWYPGEQDGRAIAALLYGDVDPSGRLPVTFPASAATAAVHSASQWPGVNLTTDYSEGLEVGYRYDHATGTRPLFPFGFGLSYTRFTMSDLVVTSTDTAVSLRVTVTNRGRRAGTAVPEAYLTFPAAAGEPPAQLVAFDAVALAAGRSRTVHLTVPASAFEAYLGGTFTAVPGTYQLSVGSSSSDLALTAPVAPPVSAPVSAPVS
jgi:beta-glucosidase